MAITSVGYDGTVTESQWARMMANVGAPAVVEGVSEFNVTVVSGVDRTYTVAVGTAHAHGVMATLTPAQTIQSATVGSGTRWDAICLRRDWTANTTTLVIVQGTATQALPAGLLNAPGTSHDQVLALAQITAGQQLPTAVVDLRVWGSKVLTVGSLLGLPSATRGTVARVSGREYVRDLDVTQNLAWVPQPVAGGRLAHAVGGERETGITTILSIPSASLSFTLTTARKIRLIGQAAMRVTAAGAIGEVTASFTGGTWSIIAGRMHELGGSSTAAHETVQAVAVATLQPGVYGVTPQVSLIFGSGSAIVSPGSLWSVIDEGPA